jgi:ribonuclease Z
VDLDLVFLGTSGSVPTPTRAPSATLIRRGGARLLVDCGEGTQRQLLRSSVGLADLDAICFTHYHGDHVLGLPGLLKTFGLRAREPDLRIFGPPGLGDLFRVLEPLVGRLPFRVLLQEVPPGEVVEGDGYRLEAHRALHRGPANAWVLAEDVRPGRFDVEEARRAGVPEGPLFGRLQRGEAVEVDGRVVEPASIVGAPRPGRRIVVTGDTRPCKSVLAAAEGADVLVHEATFASEDADRARETAHSTAVEAAAVARQAGVRLLALTHLGQRVHPRVMLEEARPIFAETVVPRDFDIIDVPLPERGPPELRRGGAIGWAEARDRGLVLEPSPPIHDPREEEDSP